MIDMSTSIRLSADVQKRLDFLAARTGRSKAFYLRTLIEDGLEEMEDLYLATETLNRVRRGEELTFSSEAVRKDLGLDD
jgi:RHH-type transcriptional regulator, rel operon repressor / antitoxin RelB